MIDFPIYRVIIGRVRAFRTERANVVATITQKSDLDQLNGQADPALPDVLEFRLDNLVDHLELVKNTLIDLPDDVVRLITVRSPEENGANDLSELRRLEIYDQFADHCDLVDTEVASLQKASFQNFHLPNAQIVASFHDFSGFPGEEKLKSVVAQAYTSGADIAKVAVVVNEFSELAALVDLVEGHIAEGRKISAMGMGPLGKVSRLVLAKAGSCLNYGYFQTENAPGQWSAERLTELVAEI